MTDFLREQSKIATSMQQEADRLLAEINIRRFWRRMHHGHEFLWNRRCACGQLEVDYQMAFYDDLEVCPCLKNDTEGQGRFPEWFREKAFASFSGGFLGSVHHECFPAR